MAYLLDGHNIGDEGMGNVVTLSRVSADVSTQLHVDQIIKENLLRIEILEKGLDEDVSADEVIRKSLTTNVSGFLRDCKNMMQGVNLCIERLERGFKNVDAGVKPLEEVLKVFTDKVHNLKLFEPYSELVHHKIGDVLTHRVKMEGDIAAEHSRLTVLFTSKPSPSALAEFDAFIEQFNQEMIAIRKYLLEGHDDLTVRTYLEQKLAIVKPIVVSIEKIICGNSSH